MKKSNDMIDQCLGNIIIHFTSISFMRLKVMYLVYLVDILQLNISEEY